MGAFSQYQKVKMHGWERFVLIIDNYFIKDERKVLIEI